MPDRERTPHNPPEHLESLYLLAQVLTTNAAEAARLVEATYRRAAREMPSASAEAPSAGHLEYARIMRKLAHSSAHVSASDASISASSAEAPDEYMARDFRRRAALRLTRQKLPAVFATLPAEARLLLLLCKVEQYSCADAGRVLDLTAEKACARLDRAMQALRERLYENAAPAERALLAQVLTDDALRTVLRQMVASEFAAPPSSLREVATALGPPSAPEARQATQRATETTPQQRQDADTRGTIRFSPGKRLQRAFLALLIIGFVGTIGYLAEQWFVSGPETNVVALSVRETGRTQAALQTNSTAAAELFVREQLGQRLNIPSIEGASLQSISIVEIASDVRVPVLRYKDTAEGNEEAFITTYVYTYALLGEHEDRLQIDRDILRQIGERNQAETRTIGDQAVLIWRDRDEIFVATTSGDPDALRGRLSF